MKLLSLALLAALCPLPALAHDHFISSQDAQPPFSEATYYNGQYYSTACRDWDDDGDGVSNCHDHCSDTAAGVDVGYRGCPVPGALTDGESSGHHHDGQPCGCQHPPHAAAREPEKS